MKYPVCTEQKYVQSYLVVVEFDQPVLSSGPNPRLAVFSGGPGYRVERVDRARVGFDRTSQDGGTVFEQVQMAVTGADLTRSY